MLIHLLETHSPYWTPSFNQGKWKHSSSWQPIFSTALRQVQPFHHLIEGAGEDEQEEPVMAASPFAMNVLPEDAETGDSLGFELPICSCATPKCVYNSLGTGSLTTKWQNCRYKMPPRALNFVWNNRLWATTKCNLTSSKDTTKWAWENRFVGSTCDP